MGSARTGGRMGDRVLSWVKSNLTSRQGTLGDANITHDVTVLDPVDLFDPQNGALSEMSSGELSVPTFFVQNLPPRVEAIRDTIQTADCYIIVSPEYNHVVPPGLASLMGHFGGSNYVCKPSGIVTYSPGPWGGMRAAMSINTMCHELGCLPVSALCGLPTVTELLKEDGTPNDPDARMLKQLPQMLDQLEWMAVAMKRQRDETGTF